MEFKNLTVEDRGPVRIVTVNRPEVLNALNADTIGDFENLAKDLEGSDLRVVILTGAGEKAFVAGADISELAACDAAAALAVGLRGQRAFSAFENAPQVFIAAINGFALGGGCEVAMACDIRIGSEAARLGQPEVKLGVIPGYGGTQRLTRLVGPGQAKKIICSGGMVKADEALRIGLLDEVVPVDELMTRAEALAAEIAAQAPLAVAACKRLVNRAFDGTLDEGLQAEADAFGGIFDSEDMREGTAAFLEKRKAEFKGK